MDDDTEELISRLFALLTAQLEDGSRLRPRGKDGRPCPPGASAP